MKYSQAIFIACVGGVALVSASPAPPTESGVALPTQPSQDPLISSSISTGSTNPATSSHRPHKRPKGIKTTEINKQGRVQKQGTRKQTIQKKRSREGKGKGSGKKILEDGPKPAHSHTQPQSNIENPQGASNHDDNHRVLPIVPPTPGAFPATSGSGQGKGEKIPGPPVPQSGTVHSGSNVPPAATAPVAARHYEESLFLRDLEEDLFARAFDDELTARSLLTKFTAWRERENKKKSVKLAAAAEKAAQKAVNYGAANNAASSAVSDQAAMAMRGFDEEVYSREFDENMLTRDFSEEIFVRDVEDALFSRDFNEDFYARDYDEQLYARAFEDDLEVRAPLLEKINQWRAESEAMKAIKLRTKADKASQKAATYGAMSGVPPADLGVAVRDFDEDLFARELEEELFSRGLDEELLSRNHDGEIFVRDFENELVVRDFNFGGMRTLFAGGSKASGAPTGTDPSVIAYRDIDDELFIRDMILDALDTRDINELD